MGGPLGTFPNAGGFGGSMEMEMATCRWNIAFFFFSLDHVESFMVGFQLMRIFDWPAREREGEGEGGDGNQTVQI